MNYFPEGSYQIGPFMGVTKDKDTIKSYKYKGNTRKLRFVCYTAYNACGLIGPENNGIAVLDEDMKQVICDKINKDKWGDILAQDDFEKLVEWLTEQAGNRFRTVIS